MSIGTETHCKTCGALIKDDQPPECPYCEKPPGLDLVHQECLERWKQERRVAEELLRRKGVAESYERAQLVAEEMEQRWEPVDALLKQHERIMHKWWTIGAVLAMGLAAAFADGKCVTALAMVILMSLIFHLTDSVFKLLRSVLCTLDEIIQKQNDVSATTVLYVRRHKDEADKFIHDYYEQAEN